MLIRIRKSQSTLEYALLITVVVGGLLAMQNYLKRSIQGRMQIIGDQMGDQYSPGGLTTRNETTNVSHDTINEVTTGGPGAAGVSGYTTTTITGGHQQSRSNRAVGDLDQETW